jgi:aspartyl-tRNA(Asn)/glutamyl-tRNA(Gln) amidotransferase subunit C
LAWLARIELSKEEESLFAKQLSKVLEYFHKIDEVDTSRVQPTHHIRKVSGIHREDRVKPSLTPSKALQNAPREEEGYFRTSRIV